MLMGEADKEALKCRDHSLALSCKSRSHVGPYPKEIDEPAVPSACKTKWKFLLAFSVIRGSVDECVYLSKVRITALQRSQRRHR